MAHISIPFLSSNTFFMSEVINALGETVKRKVRILTAHLLFQEFSVCRKCASAILNEQ